MPLSALLAHVDQNSGREQTLLAHSEKVAAFCSEFCGKIGLASLGRLIGLLHDSGKACLAFQTYLRSGNAALRGTVFHAYCGARYSLLAWEHGDAMRELTAELAAASICAHHSSLPDITGVDAADNLHRKAWPEPEPQYEEAMNRFLQIIRRQELDDLFEAAQREVGAVCVEIRDMLGEIPSNSKQKMLYFQLGLVQRYLLSCLLDADRYDTFLFEAGQFPEPEPKFPDLWSRLAESLEASLADFSSDTPICRSRREISEQCLAFSLHGTGIFRLSVPTGSGKTLASLRYALNCARETGKERVFYIAPYKSILDQNADEIRKKLNLADDSILLEHHGDVVIDGKDETAAERYRLLTQRWDTPIILTTAVQFLNTLFDGRSSCARRMHSLANSVIILDEFQAFPVKCTSILYAALDFLARVCGCSIVLCTATQPESEEIPIPLLMGKPGQMTANLEKTFTAFRRTRLVDKTDEGPFSATRLADFALERLSACDNLLMIFNTKSAAKAVFASVKERMTLLPPEKQIPVFCLTTSLCPRHRMDRIGAIQTILTAQMPGANRMICISTQLVEAGVDLSFQCVVRSFTGLDSIAQAAGRCNRHGESPCRDVFLVLCAEENLSHLPDIRRAQQASDQTLGDFQRNSGQFGGDPLSPDAVRRYYHYYFNLQAPQLDYPVDKRDDPKLPAPTSLFDLLSVNTTAMRYCAEHGAALPPHPTHQAFETAGRVFQAIDSEGSDVIVPYGDGKDLISRLYSVPPLAELPGLLRQAQHYCVHLFPYEKRVLDDYGAIDCPANLGVAVLKEEFYDEALGVRMRRGKMEPLIG